MAIFRTAPIADVARKRTIKQPSQRSQLAAQYSSALREALDRGEALIVELEPTEKPLTIRNRLQRAARSLGRDDLTVRRRGNVIAAYPAQE